MLQAIILTFVIGCVLGLILGVASVVFAVEEDKRVEELTTLMPGYNCGGCGFAGCANYAAALVEQEVDTTMLCKPCKKEQRERIIQYLKETPGPDGTTITIKS